MKVIRLLCHSPLPAFPLKEEPIEAIPDGLEDSAAKLIRRLKSVEMEYHPDVELVASIVVEGARFADPFVCFWAVDNGTRAAANLFDVPAYLLEKCGDETGLKNHIERRLVRAVEERRKEFFPGTPCGVRLGALASGLERVRSDA